MLLLMATKTPSCLRYKHSSFLIARVDGWRESARCPQTHRRPMID